METPTRPQRVLVVANRTASAPALLDEVRRRAEAGAELILLVPVQRDAADYDWTPGDALALLERVAPQQVRLIEGQPAAFETIRRAVEHGAFDEIVVSTAPEQLARWAHRDLPHRLGKLGVPITVIAPELDGPMAVEAALERFPGSAWIWFLD